MNLTTDTIFRDVFAVQETRGLTDAEVARSVRAIAKGGRVDPELGDAARDAVYRLAWLTNIRMVARDETGIVMNAMQWDLVEAGSMTLDELRDYVALGEPPHHGWIMLDGARANLGVLWERSANAIVEVARYGGDDLRIFVDVPLADFRAAREGKSVELEDLSPSWGDASRRARRTLERGDLLADFLQPASSGELRVRIDQLASWNLWQGAADVLEGYIEAGYELDRFWHDVLTALVELHLGDVDAARARLASVPLDDLDDDACGYLLGVARDLGGADLHAAVELLERIPEPDADVLAEIAMSRWELEEPERAFETAKRALALDPDSFGLNLLAARILHGMGEGGVLEAYDRALSILPDHPDALAERGSLHFEEGRLDLAFADLDAAVALAPDFGAARMTRARVLVAMGRGSEALDDIERLTEEEPYQDVLALYAQLAEQAGRTNSAITAWVKVLRHAIEKSEPVEQALERLEALGYEGPITFPWPLAPSQQIERFFLQAQPEHVVEDFHTLRERVFHANRQGLTRDALYAAEQLIDLLPEFFETWVTRGSVFLTAGYFEDALADAHEAMRLHPRAESPHLLAYECYRGLGQWGDAAAEITEAVARDPMSDQLQMALGGALEAAGDFEGAKKALHEALRLSPGNHEARFNLARLHGELGDHENSLAEYERVIQESPQDAATWVNAATALMHMERDAEALEYLGTALDLAPGYLLARQKMALLLADAERPAEAVVHFAISFALAEELILEQNPFRERFDEIASDPLEVVPEYLEAEVDGLLDDGMFDVAHAAVANLELHAGASADYWLLRSELAAMTSGPEWAEDASAAARRAAALREDDPQAHFLVATTSADDPDAFVAHVRLMLDHCGRFDRGVFRERFDQLLDSFVDTRARETDAVELLLLAEAKLREHSSLDDAIAERLYFRRAWLRDRAGDRQASIEDYTRCITLNPTEPTYWFNRACEHGIGGHAEAAVSDLAHAIELDSRWRERAADEEYFDPIRTDPAFRAMLRGLGGDREESGI